MIKVRESPCCLELVSEISAAAVIGLGEKKKSMDLASEPVASVEAVGRYGADTGIFT